MLMAPLLARGRQKGMGRFCGVFLMILSMTGFASTSREFPGGLLAMELRAVNHRYLDVQLRLPEELRVIEPQLREQIAAAVSRGKLECRVTLAQSGSDARAWSLTRWCWTACWTSSPN